MFRDTHERLQHTFFWNSIPRLRMPTSRAWIMSPHLKSFARDSKMSSIRWRLPKVLHPSFPFSFLSDILSVLNETLPAREAPSTPPSIHKGVWVPMITPFTQKNSINWIAYELLSSPLSLFSTTPPMKIIVFSVDQLVEYYISKGVAGVFVMSLSGEVFDMNREERLHLARVAQPAPRAP